MSEASYMLSPWKLQAVSTGWRALILNSSDPEHTILHGPQAQTSNSYYTQSLNVCTIQHLALPCFVLHFIDLFCMYVCIWVHAWQHMYGNQRTWVSSLLLWILVLELRMSNLAASTFTHWTMLLAHILCFGFNLSHEDKYGLFFLSVLKVSDFGALHIPFFFFFFFEQESSCGLDFLGLLTIQSHCPLETEAALAFTTSQVCVLDSLNSYHICNDSRRQTGSSPSSYKVGKWDPERLRTSPNITKVEDWKMETKTQTWGTHYPQPFIYMTCPWPTSDPGLSVPAGRFLMDGFWWFTKFRVILDMTHSEAEKYLFNSSQEDFEMLMLLGVEAISASPYCPSFPLVLPVNTISTYAGQSYAKHETQL